MRNLSMPAVGSCQKIVKTSEGTLRPLVLWTAPSRSPTQFSRARDLARTFDKIRLRRTRDSSLRLKTGSGRDDSSGSGCGEQDSLGRFGPADAPAFAAALVS